MAKTNGGGALSFPKGETVWVRYHTQDGILKYIVTTKNGDRSFYYLYELCDSGFKKLGKSKSPMDLERKYVEW